MSPWPIENAGPEALIIRFGDQPDPDLAAQIRAVTDRLGAALGNQVRDLVPSYTSLTVFYDLRQNDFNRLRQKIARLLTELPQADDTTGRLVEIPVWYDPSVGPDLERLAQHCRLSVDEVIQRHSERVYRVFAIGFAPGFAYLGNVDDALITPRLATPRKSVASGSVALAERQTAVYPIATPGGWNILGRTAMKMFDPGLKSLCPVTAGDRVRFVPISREEFLGAGGML